MGGIHVNYQSSKIILGSYGRISCALTADEQVLRLEAWLPMCLLSLYTLTTIKYDKSVSTGELDTELAYATAIYHMTNDANRSSPVDSYWPSTKGFPATAPRLTVIGRLIGAEAGTARHADEVGTSSFNCHNGNGASIPSGPSSRGIHSCSHISLPPFPGLLPLDRQMNFSDHLAHHT
jgi:hypothetical protein